jgi:hypothetical protein
VELELTRNFSTTVHQEKITKVYVRGRDHLPLELAFEICISGSFNDSRNYSIL